MTDRILLISHNPPPMTDRAHDWVLANGFAADARYPFRGDPLPQSLDGYAGSIVYGGRFNADALEEHPFLRDEYAGSAAASTPVGRSSASASARR
jgi:GMP synthase (glutamine-hydrolysing)